MHVITGCMFSGKSEALIAAVRTERYAQRQVVCFKPKADSRYSTTHIVSHELAAAALRAQDRLVEILPDPDLFAQAAEAVADEIYSAGVPCHQVATVEEVIDVLEQYDPGSSIAFDEFQFLDPASPFIEYLDAAYQAGRRVFIAGLDLDSRGVPFGPMPEILARASTITKLSAKCAICGGEASRSYRMEEVGGQVMVGGVQDYEPRCVEHWSPR